MKQALVVGVVVLGLLGAGAVWLFGPELPEVQVAKVERGEFRDTVTTNGKVEPSEFATARAEREGLVLEVLVKEGEKIGRGAVLARLDQRTAEADLATANARIAEAQAEIAVLRGGGSRREQVEIEQALLQKKRELSDAEAELGVAERLAAKNAGTREEVRLAKQRVEAIGLEIKAFEAKRPVLVSALEIARAEAKLREAETMAKRARQVMEMSLVRSPMAGMAYQVAARQGDYLMPGALVAQVGRTETVKVIVYVDEPELGRVKQGQSVTLTWDALAGKSWQGKVEKVPTEIVALGTRQVGEVECRIENPEGELLPGTNVNVAVETASTAGAVLVTKDALRVEGGEEGVYVVERGELAFRKIKTGARNVTSAVVLEGLAAGTEVVITNNPVLRPGTKVAVRLP